MRIGIIGKSGSGKSTAAKYLAEKYNFKLIDLDQIGKDAVDLYPAILTEVTYAFGVEYVRDGKLDRPALGKLVFSSQAELAKLNSIFFKYIIKEIEIRTAGVQNCVFEGAVLTELQIDNLLDKLIFIESAEDSMLARLQLRENTPAEVLQKRLDSQKKYDLLKESADIIIVNDGSVEQLQNKLELILF